VGGGIDPPHWITTAHLRAPTNTAYATASLSYVPSLHQKHELDLELSYRPPPHATPETILELVPTTDLIATKPAERGDVLALIPSARAAFNAWCEQREPKVDVDVCSESLTFLLFLFLLALPQQALDHTLLNMLFFSLYTRPSPLSSLFLLPVFHPSPLFCLLHLQMKRWAPTFPTFSPPSC